MAELATGILCGGGGLVVLVSHGEPNSTIPFDWDIIEATAEFESAVRTKRILLRTVRRADYQSMLSESQQDALGRLAQNTADEPIAVRDWTGGVIRRRQAWQAAAAIIIGGSKGVEDTAGLMREAGKPALPLNFHLGAQPQDIGSPRLYEDSLEHPESYMPKTHRELTTRTDALHVQDDDSAERVAGEVVAIMAGELKKPGRLQRIGNLVQTAYRKSDPVLNIILRANAAYNLGQNIPL